MVATVKINKLDRYVSSQGAENTRSVLLRNNAPEYGRSTNAKDDPDNFGLSPAGLFDDPGRFGGGAPSPNGAPHARADQRVSPRRQRVCRCAAWLVGLYRLLLTR